MSDGVLIWLERTNSLFEGVGRDVSSILFFSSLGSGSVICNNVLFPTTERLCLPSRLRKILLV